MQNSPLKLLDVVALLVDKPEEKLVTGQVGTVVELLAPDVYEVEFLDSKGHTIAVAELKRAELLLLQHEPVMAAWWQRRDSRADANDRLMNKARERNNEMLREYDFSQGIRGKYARRYIKGSNVVVLEPDVAKVFPNAQAVNSSLRSLAEIIRRRKSAVAK
jgi:hypothetical protein